MTLLDTTPDTNVDSASGAPTGVPTSAAARHGGTVATALGIHGLTAVIVLFDAWLLLRERRTADIAQPVGAHS